MIIHCTQKLAMELSGVSAETLIETSPLKKLSGRLQGFIRAIRKALS